MSLRQWAASRGIPLSTAYRAVKTGRISRLPGGWIDAAAADGRWVATMPVRVDARAVGSRSAPKGRSAGDRTLADLRRRYLEARTELEAANARLREHELARLNGTYLLASEVERTAFECARRARDRLVTIPDRVASLLTGLTDRAEIHKVLGDEVRLACDELSRPALPGAG